MSNGSEQSTEHEHPADRNLFTAWQLESLDHVNWQTQHTDADAAIHELVGEIESTNWNAMSLAFVKQHLIPSSLNRSALEGDDEEEAGEPQKTSHSDSSRCATEKWRYEYSPIEEQD